jgi:hypothetical protein
MTTNLFAKTRVPPLLVTALLLLLTAAAQAQESPPPLTFSKMIDVAGPEMPEWAVWDLTFAGLKHATAGPQPALDYWRQPMLDF